MDANIINKVDRHKQGYTTDQKVPLLKLVSNSL